MYAFVPVAVPPEVMTATFTIPADAFAGAVAMIWVSLMIETAVAAVPPNVTEVAPVKPVPVIVTRVPAANGPDAGAMLVNVGTAA